MLCRMTASDVLRWRLRACSDADFEWALDLHRTTLGDYVAQTWGWDEAVQRRIFAELFDPHARRVIQVAGRDVGVLVVDERPEELFLALLELLPEWQNRGLGTDILRWLLRRAADAGKVVSLHVLRTNPRAVALYEREGLCMVNADDARLVMRSRR